MPALRTIRPQRLLVTAVLAAALTAGLASIAPAQSAARAVTISVDGVPVSYSGPPIIVRGRVLVPLRGVFERLGATVTWDPIAQTVLAQRGGTTVTLQPGATQAFVNGQAQPLDVAPLIVGGETMVPLRFISQALGATVAWNAATAMVHITTRGAGASPPGVPAAVTAPSTSPAAAMPAETATVTVTPAARPLGVGDLLTVTATGPPRATATYAITGLQTGLLMSESPTRPGTYVGYYTIRPGDRISNSTVAVTMTAPNGQVVTANAPVPVTINSTAAVVPAAAPGAAVISSPAPVGSVGTPFTVTGTAPRGARVRVDAEYVGSVLFFNVHGSLGTQVVTADANGNWSATFTQAPPVRGVNLTISAAVLDNTGASRSPAMTIHTTIQ